MIKEDSFCGVREFTVSRGQIRLKVMELGAAITSIETDGRELALGFDEVSEYIATASYAGGIVGRYANRISGAAFTIGEKRYKLCANEGRNTLHGGSDGGDWTKRIWKGRAVGENSVEFTLISPDGDNGFPGDMKISVLYSVAEDRIRIDFRGQSGKDTYFAPTSHLYLTLGLDDILDAKIRINSHEHLEMREGLIPTGRLLPNEGEFDFSSLRRIGRDYDDCFILDGEHACTVCAGEAEVELHTDFPALQFYTGKYLDCGLKPNAGFAIEPEFYPDTPNRPEFPSALLKAGERFEKYMELVFK